MLKKAGSGVLAKMLREAHGEGWKAPFLGVARRDQGVPRAYKLGMVIAAICVVIPGMAVAAARWKSSRPVVMSLDSVLVQDWAPGEGDFVPGEDINAGTYAFTTSGSLPPLRIGAMRVVDLRANVAVTLPDSRSLGLNDAFLAHPGIDACVVGVQLGFGASEAPDWTTGFQEVLSVSAEDLADVLGTHEVALQMQPYYGSPSNYGMVSLTTSIACWEMYDDYYEYFSDIPLEFGSETVRTEITSVKVLAW